MSRFLDGYLECAAWLSGDTDTFPNGGNHDFSPEFIAEATADCARFEAENADDLANAGDDAQNGHDFWLTRNGHGAGFWDRGYGEVGERLSEAARKFGECDLYVGDDGMLYS